MYHPFIEGGFSCGNIRNRAEPLSFLQQLAQAVEAGHGEVLNFVEADESAGEVSDTSMFIFAGSFFCPKREYGLWTKHCENGRLI